MTQTETQKKSPAHFATAPTAFALGPREEGTRQFFSRTSAVYVLAPPLSFVLCVCCVSCLCE